MELIFIIILFCMLFIVSYASVQQGVAKTTGKISFDEEDDHPT